jgi:hypothetical protein
LVVNLLESLGDRWRARGAEATATQGDAGYWTMSLLVAVEVSVSILMT